MEARILSPAHRYASAGLFTLALHQSQIHQIWPSSTLPTLEEEGIGDGASLGKTASVSEEPHLWIHQNSGLLLPVLRFLGVDDQAWDGLKETAASSSQVRHHIGAFLTLLSEKGDEPCAEGTVKELALIKAIDAMVLTMEDSALGDTSWSHEYESDCYEKYSKLEQDLAIKPNVTKSETPIIALEKKTFEHSGGQGCDGSIKEATTLGYERKIEVLYTLISACIADNVENSKKCLQPKRGYDARHRVALRLLATWIEIEWSKVEAMEIMVACSLMDTEKGGTDDEQKKTPSYPLDSVRRGGMIGAAALAGGTLMAITGGLAAPAIAEGLGSLAPTLGGAIGAGVGAAAGATGSVAGTTTIAASFGAAGASLSGIKMARRTGNVEEFEFKAIGGNHDQGRLAVGILVSGLVFETEDFIKPWEGHTNNMERYALWWESENLIALSTALQDWLTSRVTMMLMKQGAMTTVLSTLLAAFSLPATLVSASDIIDSKWAIAVDRSDKAGKLLAEVLLKGLHGNRPVTLIGFSLGARVIFKCLQCLVDAGGDNAGMIERVVLLGAPIPIQNENWEGARKMVAGRFVNVYSINDWTLGITFRASLFTQGLAGIQPVNIRGIENVDVTELIEGHSGYLWKTKKILEQIELDSCFPTSQTTKSNIL